MCSFFTLLLVSALTCQALAALSEPGRPRRCCPYAYTHHAQSVEETESCQSPRDCVFRGPEGHLTYVEDACVVTEDTKRWGSSTPSQQSNRRRSKDSKRLNAEKCLGQPFNGRYLSDDEPLYRTLGVPPLRVTPFLMSDPRTSRGAVLPGLEVSDLAEETWDNLRLRIVDSDLCAAKRADHCNPRCVTVKQSGRTYLYGRQAAFVYDCEVGFYADDAGMTVSTSGHTYRIDACWNLANIDEEVCGSYLMRMPETREIVSGNNSLVLLDNAALRRQVLKLYFGRDLGETGVSTGLVQLVHHHNTADRVVVASFPLDTHRDTSFPLDNFDLLDNGGLYQVVIVKEDTSEMPVASFQLVLDEKKFMSTSVWVTIGLVSFTLASSLVYFRYLWVKKIQKVDTNRLYQDEISKAPCVLVMTDVENRQHVDIVLKLIAYLKANCCLSEVYFAMDPRTGISTQADGDPWRWCQEVTAKVSQSSNGFVLILGSPPRNMSLDIYKDFAENQAFVSTQILREMDEKSGVSVAMLPYSTPDSLPSVIPDHLKKRHLSLPQDFNQLVCDIHRIGKKSLVPCLPIKFIQPEVSDTNLAKTSAGKEILSSVNALKEKVVLFNQQSHNLLSMGTEEEEEKVKMLDPSALSKKDGKPKDKKVQSVAGETDGGVAPIHVNIEANIMSLNSDYLDGRDRSDLTDEC